MKRFLQLKIVLLLAMIVGASSAWGQAYTELYSADFTTVEAYSYTQNKTFTLSNKSWTASVSQVNSSVFYLGCNSNNAAKGILNDNSTFSAVVTALCDADDTYNSNKTTAHAYALLFDNAYSDVTKVKFEWAGGNNAFQVYLFGDSGSGYELLGSTNYATSGASTSGSVEWTGSATNYTKFAIVARPGAISSTATNKTLRASTFKIYKNSSYTITAASNNDSWGTVSLTGGVITATPASGYQVSTTDPYTLTSGTATVVQNGNKFTVTPSSDCTVTINFAAIPTHTATFSVNGDTSTQEFAEGADITFPANPADIEGKSFMGWVTTPIVGTTDEAPSFVTSATMGNADVTYYAVFALAGASSSASLTKMTSSDTFSADDKVVIVASDNVAMYQETYSSSYVNKYTFVNNVETIAADDKKWFTVSAGSTANTWKLGDSTYGYVYTSGSNNLAISTDYSTDLTLAWNETESKFTLVGNSRWVSYRSDLDTKYFRMGGQTSGNGSGVIYFDIYKYSTGGTIYRDYCTTVVATTVARPEITVAENPFNTSTTVTITCDTEDATIKYSFDGENWSDYSSTLTINETKTIYAKAIKDNNESTVASVTATKRNEAVIDVADDNIAYGSTFTVDDTKIEGGDITVESDNEDIATVDGLVITPVAVGTVTITVSTAENDVYKAGSKTFELTITAPVGGTTAKHTIATVFEETFAESTGTSGWSGNTASGELKFDNKEGWESVNGYGNGGSARFGKGNELGYAITPALGTAGDLTLTFKSGAWSGDKTTGGLVLTIEGEGTLSTSTFDLVNAEWKEYTTTITGATAATKVKFSAAQASKNRFFLDDVKFTTDSGSYSFSVTLNGNGYATFCSEYPLDFSGATDYSAWQITEVNGTTIKFEKITGSVKGGTGILLKGDYNAEITIPSVDSSTELSGNLLVGTLAPLYMSAGEYYGLKGNIFVKGTDGTVPAGRALLPASLVSSAPSLTFVFEDGETTSIQNVNVNHNDNQWYDLSGRRVENPTKGVYIMNGKKVVIK